jgi:type IV/VI secretion system ImpK/VasF family protein
MPAEPSSALLLNQFDVPCLKQIQATYYRSRLFTLSSTTNPILAAASPVFSLLERFSTTNSLPPIAIIRQDIDHEWNAFRSQLSSLKYPEECVKVAEYLLSSTLDELLGKTYLRLNNEAAEFIAFTPLSNDNIKPQHYFFQLVLSMKERANQYLDLLELAYYCLISGFEGELHLRADGRYTLDNLIQELYDLIIKNRVNKPIRLFKETQEINIPVPSVGLPKIVFKITALSLIFFFIIDRGIDTLLEQQTNALLAHHVTIHDMDMA